MIPDIYRMGALALNPEKIQSLESGGGFFSGLADFLKNPAFLQMLGAAGADLLQGSGGKNTLAATQHYNAVKDYNEMLKRMFAGDFSDGGTWKQNADGVKIDLPAPVKPATQSTGGPSTEGGSILGYGTPTVHTAAPTPQATPGTSQGMSPDMLGMISKMLSFFGNSQPGYPDFSAADVAGLSPQDIASALQLRMNADTLQQKKLTDIADTIYKQGLLDYYQRQTENEQTALGLRGREADIEAQRARTGALGEQRQWIEMMRPALYDIPGLGELTAKDFNDLPNDVKAYGYEAWLNSAQGKPMPSIDEWRKRNSLTAQEKWYERSLEDPKFKEFITDITERGATRISLGEKLDEIKAKTELESTLAGQVFFSKVEWPSMIEKEIANDEELKDQVWMNRSNPEESSKLIINATIKRIKEKISAGRGEIVGAPVIDQAKRTITWTVKWPSGKVEPITYVAK